MHPAANPCPICGSQTYEWGTLRSDGGVWYRTNGSLALTGEGLLARLCKDCGNVQIFLKDAIPRQPIFAKAREKRKHGADEG